jgi:hypothetical protein
MPGFLDSPVPPIVSGGGSEPALVGAGAPVINIGEIKADRGIDVQAEVLWALRRHDRRLDAGDGWRIHQYDDTEALVTGWQNLLTIERNSWKHANGTSIANEPGTAPLYEAVARAFAVRSALRLWILFQGDVPVAHALGVVDRQCFFLLKNSFDESYRSQSPGSVLVWRAMRAAVEIDPRKGGAIPSTKGILGG